MIGLGNFWYFGKLVAKERLSHTRGGRNLLLAHFLANSVGLENVWVFFN